LYDIGCSWDRKDSVQWWEDLEKCTDSNEFEEGWRIKVKFNVKDCGWGIWKSEGIVSTQDDISYLVYNHDVFDNDFTIAIPVPQDDEYLNIRWRCWDGVAGETFVRARMKAESGTITLDYNGNLKVTTKNLYDVAVGPYYGKNNLGKDWDDAKNRSVSD